MKELTDIITLLAKHHVDFVVAGGYAVAAYGSSLVTQDIDICCDFPPDNLMRLQQAIGGKNPVHRMTTKRLPLVLTPEKCRGLKNLYVDTEAGQLNCLGSMLGVGDYDAVKQRSIEIEIEGTTCQLIDLDALMDAKKATGRPRDMAAILELEAIRERF